MSRDVLYATRTPSPQHAIAASKAPQSFRLRNAPLAQINMAVVIRVHRREGGLEAVRHEQILQVLIATVDEESYHFLVGPHGTHLCVNQSVSPTHRHGWRRVDGAKATIKQCTGAHDLFLLERAGLVLIDHLEASASRVKELGAEFGIVP